MTRRTLALGILVALIVGSGPAAAQTGPLLPAAPNPSIAPVVAGGAEPVLAADAPEPRSPWAVDYIVGLPAGVRVQRFLGEEGVFNLELEGFAGLELILPTVGAGLRARLVPLCSTHNAIIISPGVDAYLLYNILHGGSGELFGSSSAGVGLAAADIDIAWRHTFRRHGEGEFGVKLGVGAPFGHDTNGTAVPVVGLFGGWRF
jgi:hypothetical protein